MDRPCNGQENIDKMTNFELQNTTRITTVTPLKTGWEQEN